RQVSFILAKELSGMGLTIVSGLARGVDTQAHRGAVEGSGQTVAVLGTGIDVVYPRENRKLFESILKSGVIISEFPLGTYAAPQNFPIRNRIISGLSLGTLIPEAAEFSGSLITARLTLEQNRELWAVPGNITNSGSYGPNYLIKQGAKPVICARDVLDELPVEVLEKLHEELGNDEVPDREDSELTPEKKRLLRLIPVDDSIHFDQLLSKGSQTAAALNMHLLDLEMEGRIKQIPGRHFVRLL
ncbi:MAG: DNA-protecting protein DprA, partial [Acidobacteriota bacterium]